VIQNHVISGVVESGDGAAGPSDSESVRDEKVKVLKAIPPIEEKNLVRRASSAVTEMKNGVAKDSQTETFAALKLGDQFLALEGVPF